MESLRSHPSASVELIDLLSCVSSRESVQSDERLGDVYLKFERGQHSFCAVLDGAQPAGLCSKAKLGFLLGHRFGNAVFANRLVRDQMVAHALVIRRGTALQEVLRLALSRSEEEFHEPILLVEEGGQFLGLLATSDLVALQSRLVTEKIRQLESEQQAVRDRNATLVRLTHELEESNGALSAARDTALEGTRLKSQFLANMSHEIRTPMNAVLGMAGLLLDTPLNSEQLDFVETIRTGGESLLALINDILDLSKIEAGKVELEQIDFDLIGVVEETADLVAFKAQEKGLRFRCEIDPEVPWRLLGDPVRIRQVLTNLAGNAVKFTAAGEITVRVEPAMTPAGAAGLRYSVTDTGIGIPPEKLDTLFRPFAQVDASTTRRYGGTGLGLSISRRLVELMGGLVGVESKPGCGSCFHFTVPIVLPGAAAASAVDHPIAGVAGRRFLVADAHDAVRHTLVALLTSWGGECVEAADLGSLAGQLRNAAHTHRPFALGFVDTDLVHGGFDELARTVAQDAGDARTPLVLLTAQSEGGIVEPLRQSGFAAHLNKPVRPTRLRRCLAGTLGTVPKVLTSPVAGTTSRTDDGGPRLLLVEDNDSNRKVVFLMLKRLGFGSDVVTNGAEAIEALSLRPYDLVLMDCQMPVLDGYAATRLIRDPKSAVLDHTIPVIALTASAMQSDREACRAAGMNDFVSKPVTPIGLSAVINRWTAARPQPAGEAELTLRTG